MAQSFLKQGRALAFLHDIEASSVETRFGKCHTLGASFHGHDEGRLPGIELSTSTTLFVLSIFILHSVLVSRCATGSVTAVIGAEASCTWGVYADKG